MESETQKDKDIGIDSNSFSDTSFDNMVLTKIGGKDD